MDPNNKYIYMALLSLLVPPSSSNMTDNRASHVIKNTMWSVNSFPSGIGPLIRTLITAAVNLLCKLVSVLSFQDNLFYYWRSHRISMVIMSHTIHFIVHSQYLVDLLHKHHQLPLEFIGQNWFRTSNNEHRSHIVTSFI